MIDDPAASTGESPPSPAVLRADHCIRLEEPVGYGIRRICIDYLERACSALSGPAIERDQGIHTARKALKRVRAMIALVQDTVGEEAYRQESGVLSYAARQIALARDGYVGVVTLDRIRERFGPSLGAERFGETRRRLMDRRERAITTIASDPQMLVDVVTALGTSRRRFTAWTVDGDGPEAVPDRFGSIAGGIHRVYRRSRSRMRTAYRDPSDEAFHAWRKQVKRARYHMEALEPVEPEVVGGLARSFFVLGEMLGQEHDLAQLRMGIGADQRLVPDAADRRLLVALIGQEQGRLREAAGLLGEQVLAEPPDDFVRRIRAYWSAARGC